MAVRDLTLARREGVDITKLTDSTAGTADGTLAAVSAGRDWCRRNRQQCRFEGRLGCDARRHQ